MINTLHISKDKRHNSHTFVQVTDHQFCDEIEKMYKRGIDVKMVVSPTITSSYEKEEAEVGTRYDITVM